MSTSRADVAHPGMIFHEGAGGWCDSLRMTAPSVVPEATGIPPASHHHGPRRRWANRWLHATLVAVRFEVLIDKQGLYYVAHVPDLPGCVAAGATLAEAEQMIRRELEVQVLSMRREGVPLPRRRDRPVDPKEPKAARFFVVVK